MIAATGSRHVWRLLATLVMSAAALAGIGAMSPVASAIGYQGVPQVVPGAEEPRTETVRVGDAAEAWYFASPVNLCSTPLGGCAPGSPSAISPYPVNTLHVGVVLGQEIARAYVRPDLSKLPAGAKPVGGTMTLPVAAGTTDGTLMANTAKIRACLVTKPIIDGIEGSTAPPPAIDCKTGSPLKFSPTRGGRFRIDLAPFLAAWASGKPEFGMALVPDAGAAPSDLWHVAFSGRHRAGIEGISSTIKVEFLAASPTPSPTPTESEGVPPVDLPTEVPSLPPVVTAPQTGPPPVLAPSPVAQATGGYSGFQYPAAFLIPLGLLGLAMFLVRLFTRDLTPQPPLAVTNSSGKAAAR